MLQNCELLQNLTGDIGSEPALFFSFVVSSHFLEVRFRKGVINCKCVARDEEEVVNNIASSTV